MSLQAEIGQWACDSPRSNRHGNDHNDQNERETLKSADVRAILESCYYANRRPPDHLKFTIVPVLKKFSRLLTAPPPYQFDIGLYVLLPPPKSAPRSSKARNKLKRKNAGKAEIEPDNSTKPPAHLAHLYDTSLTKTPLCKWSLSGPQCANNSAMQQRYCYPKESEGFGSTKGGTLWTMCASTGEFDEKGQPKLKELKQYRLLHVYHSVKRANRGRNSDCESHDGSATRSEPGTPRKRTFAPSSTAPSLPQDHSNHVNYDRRGMYLYSSMYPQYHYEPIPIGTVYSQGDPRFRLHSPVAVPRNLATTPQTPKVLLSSPLMITPDGRHDSQDYRQHVGIEKRTDGSMWDQSHHPHRSLPKHTICSSPLRRPSSDEEDNVKGSDNDETKSQSEEQNDDPYPLVGPCLSFDDSWMGESNAGSGAEDGTNTVGDLWDRATDSAAHKWATATGNQNSAQNHPEDEPSPKRCRVSRHNLWSSAPLANVSIDDCDWAPGSTDNGISPSRIENSLSVDELSNLSDDDGGYIEDLSQEEHPYLREM